MAVFHSTSDFSCFLINSFIVDEKLKVNRSYRLKNPYSRKEFKLEM